MIDLAAARRRTAWLAFLRIGDRVRFFGGTGEHAGIVEAIEVNRIWIGWEIPGARIRSWVFRDTGDCPGARTRIEPAETVLPAIGGDDQDPGGLAGGVIKDTQIKLFELADWHGWQISDLVSLANLYDQDFDEPTLWDADPDLALEISDLLDVESMLALGGCLDAP